MLSEPHSCVKCFVSNTHVFDRIIASLRDTAGSAVAAISIKGLPSKRSFTAQAARASVLSPNWRKDTMRRYRIRFPLTAVRRRATVEQQTILAIPPGAVIAVTGESDDAGLVEAEFNGETVAVFQSDLDECAERVASM